MAIPSWLSALTGANKFAAPGGQANFGDLLQAGGHSMLQHYRGKGGTFGAEAPLDLAALINPQVNQQASAPVGPAITGAPLRPAANAPRPFAQASAPANPWGIGMTGGVW